jgi:hypothetical protein
VKIRIAAATTLALAGIGIAAPASAAPTPRAYTSCVALKKVYPQGVGLRGAIDKTIGYKVRNFYVSNTAYRLNDGRVVASRQYDLDHDNDGIACEPFRPTVAQRNAQAKARSYLEYSAFSRLGLIDQLIYEKFSKVDAAYGVNVLRVNWTNQAIKKAQSYLRYSAFSRQGLIDQLLYEKFTLAQATAGVNAVGL